MIIRDESPEPFYSQPDQEPPDPVEGYETRLSTRSMAWKIVGCVAGIAVGFVFLGAAVYNAYMFFTNQPRNGEPIPLTILGIVVVAGFSTMTAMLIQKLRNGRRLVIGRERMQILEGSGGAAAVLVSIPYANIERLKCTRLDFGMYQLDFELADTHDPETYLPGINIEANYLASEFHYTLSDAFEEPTPELYDRIKRARKKLRSREKGKGE